MIACCHFPHQRRKKRWGFLGLVWIALLVLLPSVCYGIQDQQFVSPPLREFDGERIAISIPKGWKITRKDTPYYWTTREYTFYLEHTTQNGKAIVAHVMIGHYTIYRGEQGGSFTGKRFRTSSGLRGWLDEDEMPAYLHYDEGRSHRWNLEIPHPLWETVPVLRVDCFPKDKALVKRLVQPLFRSFRYVLPGKQIGRPSTRPAPAPRRKQEQRTRKVVPRIALIRKIAVLSSRHDSGSLKNSP